MQMHSRPLDLDASTTSIIERDFSHLYSGELGLSSIPGGQTAADSALARLDITGYAQRRSEVLPRNKRGASMLSPYIRHNILTLGQVHRETNNAPFKDREKFHDELMWQEYARHLYARLGTRLFDNLRFQANRDSSGHGWNREMSCINEVVNELETDGWLVNQSRMWLASHWTVRNNIGWLSGQELMYRSLIDGSRAANLLGWQWTVGAGTGNAYGFARWQVEKRAPELCESCPLNSHCPIQEFPDDSSLHQLDRDPLLDRDPDPETTSGPLKPVVNETPKHVLITIDSMGDHDPALEAHPDLPVVFVFNEAALLKLQLSSQRLGFYLDTLKDLAERRDLHVFLGDPYVYAQKNPVAVTFAPVPSFRKFKNLAELHPYPWFKKPHAGSIKSFSSWRKSY
jgi:deoxyribodipyrimidine photo-lyase